jgi:Flp pilus assembly protein TadB
MICQHCGMEYPDELKECPGCHAPNEETAAQVMSEDERDSFEGITIDSAPDTDTYRVMDQDDLRQEQEENRPWKERALSFLLRHSWLIWLFVLLALIAAAAFFLLPVVGIFFVIVLIIGSLRALFL